MERNIDRDRLSPALEQNGFLRTTAFTWVNVIGGKRYLVDFKNKHVCRTQGEHNLERIHEDTEDSTLNAIIKMCEDVMGGESAQDSVPAGSYETKPNTGTRPAPANPKKVSGEQSSGEAPSADQSKRGVQEEKSTNEEKASPAYQNNDTQPAAQPVEKPSQPSPAAGKKSTPLLDLIHGYVGNDVLEVFGDTGSGKSKFALAVAREAIAAGKKVYYLDTERNLTPADIAGMKGCEYKYTPVIEEIDKLTQNLPAADVVIIDSIGFPVLTAFARMDTKKKGDALLKLIAIFGDLKKWAYAHNGVAIVTNQPESEFNKAQDHVLRPFGDKSQFAAKEIWKTEIMDRKPAYTNIRISAFRSRSVGHRTKIADMKITGNGVEVQA
jgi:RecA/RadA recombinase